MARFIGLVVACGFVVACASQGTTSGAGGDGTGAAETTGGGATSASGGTTSSGGGDGAGGSGTGGDGAGGSGTGGDGAGGSGTGGDGAGGGGSGGGATCTWQSGTNPCGQGMYCDAPGCGQGTCSPVTNMDDTVKSPVCGCDGVDYWNAATASNHGMAVASSGPCPNATFCGGLANIQCPDPAHFCAYDVGSSTMCNVSDAGGSCWGMPLTCNIIGFGGQYRDCASPNGACLYECEAIKSGQTYWGPDNSCPQ